MPTATHARARATRSSGPGAAALTLGVFVESVCGGRGICGRCQVLPAYGRVLALLDEWLPRLGGDIFERTFAVTAAPGEKCERCWCYSEELGTESEHPAICPKCTAAVV